MRDFTHRDMEMFKYAKRAAMKSTYSKKVKIGCIAVLNNTILSSGSNGDKTHPLQKTYNKYKFIYEEDISNMPLVPKIHAEIDCLSKIKDSDIQWNKVRLYLYRICKSREHGMSRPCLACMKFIKDLGIKHIYYTTDQGYAYELIN